MRNSECMLSIQQSSLGFMASTALISSPSQPVLMMSEGIGVSKVMVGGLGGQDLHNNLIIVIFHYERVCFLFFLFVYLFALKFTVPVKNTDKPSYSSEWVGVSKLLTGTVN